MAGLRAGSWSSSAGLPGTGTSCNVERSTTMEIRERRTPPPELGPMLNRARLRAGLRGREAARLAGIDAGYLVRLESGQRVPSTVVAQVLAALFGLDETERAVLFDAAVDDAGRGYWRRQRALARIGTGLSG